MYHHQKKKLNQGESSQKEPYEERYLYSIALRPTFLDATGKLQVAQCTRDGEHTLA